MIVTDYISLNKIENHESYGYKQTESLTKNRNIYVIVKYLPHKMHIHFKEGSWIVEKQTPPNKQSPCEITNPGQIQILYHGVKSTAQYCAISNKNSEPGSILEKTEQVKIRSLLQVKQLIFSMSRERKLKKGRLKETNSHGNQLFCVILDCIFLHYRDNWGYPN